MSRWLGEGEKSYYKRVETFLESEGGHEDELFLKNVLKQVLADGAKRVCCDKDGSRAVERILRSLRVDALSLQKLIEALSGDYYNLATDRCGSHVMETLLRESARLLKTDGSEDLQDHFFSMCTTMKTHLSEFIAHPYASHVLSAMVQVLSGVYISDHLSRSKYSQEFRKAKMTPVTSLSKQKGEGQVETKIDVPKSFIRHLEAVGKAICKLSTLSVLLTHKCASPVLQVALRALTGRQPIRGKKLAEKIMQCPGVCQPENEDTVPSLFTDAVASHLMDTLIAVSSPTLYQHIYDTCFRGRLVVFALHKVANYPLQQLIITATPTQVSLLMEELSPHLEEILCAGHMGVVVCLTQVASLCPQVQPAFLHTLLTTFHTESTPKCVVPLLLAMLTHEVYYSRSEGDEEEVGGEVGVEQPNFTGSCYAEVNLPVYMSPPQTTAAQKPITIHGSLIVQSLLLFQDSKMVARSLLQMVSQGDDIVRVSCDPSGSHVLESFMASRSVPVKRKNRLVEMITTQGHLVPLCTDRNGSRVMDAVWRHCEVGRKEEIAKELLAHEDKLSSDFYGQIVLRNCNVAHYRKKHSAWQAEQQAAERRRGLFRDIFSEEDASNLGRSGEKNDKARSKGRRAKRKMESGTTVKRKRKIPLFESDSESEPTPAKRTKT